MKNEDYMPTNREKTRQPKLGKHYCGGCDGVLLGDGEKCPNCNGYDYKNKRAPKRDYK